MLQAGLGILLKADFRSALARLHCPTLFVAGQGDPIVPVGAAEEAVRRAPDARLEVIEGAGHAMLVSHPKQTHEALLSFVLGDPRARLGAAASVCGPLTAGG
jgi:pimeloyl-ACP methyl ester carboxylesterase